MGELKVNLDRSSPVPLYYQVARQIESAIASGTLAPGDRLENEVALADRLGLSRPTMRRAVHELVTKGLLVRKRGVGTQVLNAHVRRNDELTSLYDDLARHQQEPSTLVLVREIVPAGDAVADNLGLVPGTDVLHLERLRCTGGQPLALMSNWLPAELAPALSEQQLTARGLYELIRARGIHLRVARQRIGARRATDAEAERLGISRRVPLLTTERVAYDDRGAAVEFSKAAYRSDSYSIEITVVG